MHDSAFAREELMMQVDAVVARLPPVERACATCRFASIPPMPAEDHGWYGKCEAPLPVNVMLDPRPVQLWFAAAEAARWNSKRQRPCPAWQEKPRAALDPPGLPGAA